MSFGRVDSETDLDACFVEFFRHFCRSVYFASADEDAIGEAKMVERLPVGHDASTFSVELSGNVSESGSRQFRRDDVALSYISIDRDHDVGVEQSYQR